MNGHRLSHVVMGDSRRHPRLILLAIAACVLLPVSHVVASDEQLPTPVAGRVATGTVDSRPKGYAPPVLTASEGPLQYEPLMDDGSIAVHAYETSWQDFDTSDTTFASSQSLSTWLDKVQVGYDDGFVISSSSGVELNGSNAPYMLRINGWGQLRHTVLDSHGPNPDLNQFQLIRGRLSFSGNAFSPNFSYYAQLDGRSSSGDDVRLLDYVLNYDFGRALWNLERGSLGIRVGKYKVPVTFARELSGREFEFADRSMSSIYFDVNRSLGWGLYGRTQNLAIPLYWETTLFNGLVTGGAETGSSGDLDNNLAYAIRIHAFPIGDWGEGSLADFDWHDRLAMRIGAGFAASTINREGSTEFSSIRTVDTGIQLSDLLPLSVDQYTVEIYCVNASYKYRGWSLTNEYYFRNINDFQGAAIPDLFDHGLWFQLGKFVVPGKMQLLSRWSYVIGDSGTLGSKNESATEVAGGCVWYFREQNAKLTFDFTHLNGAPINSASLGIAAGTVGWLFRTQLQFAF